MERVINNCEFTLTMRIPNVSFNVTIEYIGDDYHQLSVDGYKIASTPYRYEMEEILTNVIAIAGKRYIKGYTDGKHGGNHGPLFKRD